MNLKLFTFFAFLFVFNSCYQAPPDFEETEAYQAYINEDYCSAIRLTYQLREQYPRDITFKKTTSFYLGHIYKAEGKYADAIPHFKFILNPSRFHFLSFLDAFNYYDCQRRDAYVTLAKLYHEQKDYQKSIENIQKAEQAYGCFGCGTMALMSHLELDDLYLKNFLQLNDLTSTLEQLGDRLFNLESTSPYFFPLLELFHSQYTSIEIKEAFQHAAQQIQIHEVKESGLTFYEVETVFLDIPITLDSYQMEDSVEEISTFKHSLLERQKENTELLYQDIILNSELLGCLINE